MKLPPDIEHYMRPMKLGKEFIDKISEVNDFGWNFEIHSFQLHSVFCIILYILYSQVLLEM